MLKFSYKFLILLFFPLFINGMDGGHRIVTGKCKDLFKGGDRILNPDNPDRWSELGVETLGLACPLMVFSSSGRQVSKKVITLAWNYKKGLIVGLALISLAKIFQKSKLAPMSGIAFRKIHQDLEGLINQVTNFNATASHSLDKIYQQLKKANEQIKESYEQEAKDIQELAHTAANSLLLEGIMASFQLSCHLIEVEDKMTSHKNNIQKDARGVGELTEDIEQESKTIDAIHSKICFLNPARMSLTILQSLALKQNQQFAERKEMFDAWLNQMDKAFELIRLKQERTKRIIQENNEVLWGNSEDLKILSKKMAAIKNTQDVVSRNLEELLLKLTTRPSLTKKDDLDNNDNNNKDNNN